MFFVDRLTVFFADGFVGDRFALGVLLHRQRIVRRRPVVHDELTDFFIRGAELVFGEHPDRTFPAHAFLGNRDIRVHVGFLTGVHRLPARAGTARERVEIARLAAAQQNPVDGFQRQFADVGDQPGS